MAETTKPATMRDAFSTAVDNLRPAYPVMCDMWLSKLTPVSFQAGTLTLAAPDQRTRDICALRIRRLLFDELHLVTGRRIAVEYVVQAQGGASC